LKEWHKEENMERLKMIHNCLLDTVVDNLGHLDAIDAQEMGEVVDMIKDIAETMYYHTVIEAMLEKEEVHHIKKEV
jgi:hypothetical protein